MDIAEFYAARLDEDEAAARESYYEGQRWITEEEGVYRWPDDELVQMADRKADARHIARWDPVRVLREAEAGRKILARYEDCLARQEDPDYPAGEALDQAREYEDFVLPNLAAVYSDHLDYRQEWKV